MQTSTTKLLVLETMAAALLMSYTQADDMIPACSNTEQGQVNRISTLEKLPVHGALDLQDMGTTARTAQETQAGVGRCAPQSPQCLLTQLFITPRVQTLGVLRKPWRKGFSMPTLGHSSKRFLDCNHTTRQSAEGFSTRVPKSHSQSTTSTLITDVVFCDGNRSVEKTAFLYRQGLMK